MWDDMAADVEAPKAFDTSWSGTPLSEGLAFDQAGVAGGDVM